MERLEALQASNKEMQAEVEALRSEVVTGRSLPEDEQVTETARGESSGVLVRAAMWLEQLLRRGGRS